MISKFPFKCAVCGTAHPAGAEGIFNGNMPKGKRMKCLTCAASGKANDLAIPQPVRPSRNASPYTPDFEVNWAELRPMLIAATDPNGKLTGWNNAQYRERFRKEFKGSSFAGFSAGEVNRWLREGYKTSAIAGLSGLMPPLRKRQRARFVEDGDELHLDRVYSGEEKFMSMPERREVMAGVRLNIELDASAGSSGMLFPYQRWMAQSIYALLTSGVDCEVSIFTLSRNLFRHQSGTCRQRVTVKRFGEMADFAGFSAMFSPAAFRGIMFSTFALHADRQGLQLGGYGSGVTTKWGAEYNKATRSIEVRCNWTASTFPEGEMTAKLREAIKAMQKDVR